MRAKELLKKLGFTDKETQVYLALLRLGKSSPSQLSKATKVSRPTIYNVVKSLSIKGLVADDFTDKQLFITPLPPEQLWASFEQAKAGLLEKEVLIGDAVKELHLLKHVEEYPVPKMRFVIEQDLKDFLYYNADRWYKSMLSARGVWWGFQDHSFLLSFRDWVDWSSKLFAGFDFKVCLFTNESPVEKGMKGRILSRLVKFLPDSQFTTTTWVAGDFLIMVQTRNHPFYLVEIHDAEMARNTGEVFERLWKLT